MIKADKQIKGAKVLVLGLTFKENVPDTRNTRVIDIVRELKEYGIEVHVADPVADRAEAMHEYGLEIEEETAVSGVAAIIAAVSHKEFQTLDFEKLKKKYKNGSYVLVDVKGMFDRKEAEDAGYLYWRL